jgi:hypothetical protein
MENKYTYREIEHESGYKVVKRTDSDGNEAWIPIDPGNSDYAEYLASLEGKEPNLPEVIETPETSEAE